MFISAYLPLGKLSYHVRIYERSQVSYMVEKRYKKHKQ